MVYNTSYGQVVVGDIADLYGSASIIPMYGNAPVTSDRPTVICPIDYLAQIDIKQNVTSLMDTYRNTVFSSQTDLESALSDEFVDLKNNTVFVWGNYEKGGLGFIFNGSHTSCMAVMCFGNIVVQGGVQPLISDVTLSYSVTLSNGGEQWVYDKLGTSIETNGNYKNGIIFYNLYDYDDSSKLFVNTNSMGISYGCPECCMSYKDGDDPIPVRNLHNINFYDSPENTVAAYLDGYCTDMPTSIIDVLSEYDYIEHRSLQRKINYYNAVINFNNYSFVEGTSLFSGATNESVNPYPNSTSSGGGGYGGGSRYSTPCGDDTLPQDGIVGTGVVDLYLLTKSQMAEFARYLYTGITESVSNTIKRLLANPLDGVVSAHMVRMTPSVSGVGNIKYCGIDTGCSASLVATEYYMAIYEINIASFYNNFLDYAGNTKLQIYIPYIGVKDLDINEFIGGKLKLTLKYDIVSGSIIAMVYSVLTQKGFNHVNLNSCLYTFTGTCIRPIPITGSNWSSLFGSLTAMAIGVMTENPVAVAGGIGSLTGGMVKTSANSSIGSSFGYLNKQEPYVILTHPEPSVPDALRKYRGYKTNVTVRKLSDAIATDRTNFIKVRQGSLDLTGIHATDAEKEEIARLLYEGVYYEYR